MSDKIGSFFIKLVCNYGEPGGEQWIDLFAAGVQKLKFCIKKVSKQKSKSVTFRLKTFSIRKKIHFTSQYSGTNREAREGKKGIFKNSHRYTFAKISIKKPRKRFRNKKSQSS